jgi:hypothetical protein
LNLAHYERRPRAFLKSASFPRYDDFGSYRFGVWFQRAEMQKDWSVSLEKSYKWTKQLEREWYYLSRDATTRRSWPGSKASNLRSEEMTICSCASKLPFPLFVHLLGWRTWYGFSPSNLSLWINAVVKQCLSRLVYAHRTCSLSECYLCRKLVPQSSIPSNIEQASPGAEVCRAKKLGILRCPHSPQCPVRDDIADAQIRQSHEITVRPIRSEKLKVK